MNIKKNFNTINIWIKINFRSSIPEAKISSTLKQKPIRLIVPPLLSFTSIYTARHHFTVPNYGGLYRKFNNKRGHSSTRCTRMIAGILHAVRTPRDCVGQLDVVDGWSIGSNERALDAPMASHRVSFYRSPPPPHLIYSRASVSPSNPAGFRRWCMHCPLTR